MTRVAFGWICGGALAALVIVAGAARLISEAVDERERLNAEAGMERVTPELFRYQVPGGWVYKSGRGLCFVPDDSVEAGR